jgi:hypothetical protein
MFIKSHKLIAGAHKVEAATLPLIRTRQTKWTNRIGLVKAVGCCVNVLRWPCGEPFYVGKSIKNRDYHRIRYSRGCYNGNVFRCIHMIEHDLKEKVTVEIPQDGMTEWEELPYERQLIQHYGCCGHEPVGTPMNESLT